jgi:hypothetical protein
VRLVGAHDLHHPVVSDLSLTFETMHLSADEGQSMFAYNAESGSKSEAALNLLGSWAVTLERPEASNQVETANAPNEP